MNTRGAKVSSVSGGDILAKILLVNKVSSVYAVPGESYLGFLDAVAVMPGSIDVITCRHEAAACNMAVAYAKLTGEPGVCMVSRGPGATHASIGVHTAMQDAAPIVLFIGQVERRFRHRDAFQEIDYEHMFARLAKWTIEINDVARLSELVTRAFSVAANGRPGPVVVVLPEDLLNQVSVPSPIFPFARADAGLSAEATGALRDLLGEAQRPLLVLGGGGWDAGVCEDIRLFAETARLPVATGYRRQDLFANDHELYVGELGLTADAIMHDYVRNTDLLIVVGEAFGETTTKDYSMLPFPDTGTRLFHVLPGPEDLGRLYHAERTITCSPRAFAASTKSVVDGLQVPDRSEWIRRGRTHYELWSTPKTVDVPINVADIVCHMRATLPADAVVTTGAGAYAAYISRYYRFRKFGTQLGPISGAMGFGLPAAIAAKRLSPDRTVISLAGDGCFMMAVSELATIAKYDLDIVIVVINNSSYGSIHWHQVKQYQGRSFATDLTNPDFAALAESFGIAGYRVENIDEFKECFGLAVGSGKASLVEVKTDMDAMLKSSARG